MPKVTSARPHAGHNTQSLAVDQFSYFFLRLRKHEIRRTVNKLRSKYPGENPEQLSRRLIDAQTQLSILGGAFSYLPFLLPEIGLFLRLVGIVGTSSMLSRMHLYLILEIAYLHGKDIEDQARIGEMAAIVSATGLAAGAPLLMDALGWTPVVGLPASVLGSGAVTQLIGQTAISHYGTRA